MGILNVTPDSFSDGGRYADPVVAIAAGHAMRDAGADIIDVGGESTRPDALPVPPAQEAARVEPVIAALAAQGVVVSADTRNAETMAAALNAGARIINDVSGLRHDPAALPLLAARGCPVVIMHMRGSPMTMNCQAVYNDVVADVLVELGHTRDAALRAGIEAGAIALDPGLGFAKRGAQNVALLRALPRFAALGHALLIGLSRKKFIGEAGGEPASARRLPGSLAAALFAVGQGANILRVHDVAETVQALRVWQSLTVADSKMS
ncbi:MAG: dihydropteroate synthase [Acidocella sp.]|nr:dihydropteroate synthase [Acidocella sp.]